MANSQEKTKSKVYTAESVKRKLNPNVVMPEKNDKKFEDIVGNKDIVTQLSNISELFKSGGQISIFGNRYHPSFALSGELGIGKTMVASAFAKNLGFPMVIFNCERLAYDPSEELFEGIKKFLEPIGKCVVFFKEIYFLLNADESKAISTFNLILNLRDSFPDSFFFVSTSIFSVYPSFFLGSDGFDTIYEFNPPDLEERKELINRFLKAIPHDEKMDVENLARDLFGYTGGNIKNFLRKAYISARLTKQKILTYELIDQTISSDVHGGKINQMTRKTIVLTAIHEAGHLIAGYYGCPGFEISKVEVIHRNDSLGLTTSQADDNKLNYTRRDIIGRIVVDYGGYCAEKLIFNTSTAGVFGDIQNATALAKAYVFNWGMDDDFGLSYVDQNEFQSYLLQIVGDARVRILLQKVKEKTLDLLLEHKSELIVIAKELVHREILYKEDIIGLLKYPPCEEEKFELDNLLEELFEDTSKKG